MVALSFLLMALQLGGGFDAAAAEATVVDRSTVEIAVSVSAQAGSSVVVHAVDPGGEQRTVAMLEVTPGVYRTRFTTRPLDLVVIFEHLESGAQSDPVRLTTLGVAPELVGVLGVPTPPQSESDGSSWGWLAIALAAASLSALAFWTLGARRPEEVDDDGRPGAVETADAGKGEPTDESTATPPEPPPTSAPSV